MPKLANSSPKYRRHKASGQAVVTIGGKDIYLGPHGSKASKAEYDRLVGEWLVSGRRLAPTEHAEAPTVAELSAAYILWAERYYRKNGKPTRTIERIRIALRVLRQPYGHTSVAAFGPLALQAIQQQLVREGRSLAPATPAAKGKTKRVRPKSRPYINCLVEEVRRLFKWGVAQELVPASVLHGLSAVRGLSRGRTDAPEPKPVLPVDDATVEATLPHLPPIVADMVRLQRLTAMRPGEVCILRPCDVDRSGDVWLYRPAEHKTEHHGRDRVVFLGPRAQAILRPYLLRDSQAYCFSPRESIAKHRAELREHRKSPVQPSQLDRRKRRPKRSPGERYDVAAYDRAIARACEQAFPVPPGLETDATRAWHREHRWTPNRLRHSAATVIRGSFGLDAAQVILGHAHAQVTEVYAERDHARAAAIVREVG